jgi:hypothetical protein
MMVNTKTTSTFEDGTNTNSLFSFTFVLSTILNQNRIRRNMPSKILACVINAAAAGTEPHQNFIRSAGATLT